MLRIGIIGFGGMGHNHASHYLRRNDCRLVAIADKRPEQLQGKSLEINVGAPEPVRLSGIQIFASGDEMLRRAEMDIVSICLPTDLHAEYAIKALRAGCHVLCEKPMSRTLHQADAMLRVREKSGRLLMIAQCLRFWPCYEKVVEVHRSGEFGRLLFLSLRRVSAAPRWASDNWFLDGRRSGGALIDLHVHDTDFVNHLLGVPAAVVTTGLPGESGAIDTAATQYHYPGGPVVVAETTWAKAGPFNMSFLAVFEGVTLEMGCRDADLFLARKGEKEYAKVPLAPGTGHGRTVDYFVECVKAGREPERCTPWSTRETMRIAFAEEKSARASGRRVGL